ncbi:putative nitroreductase HBN1 [Diplogelasinospora grovesii]|uniref:Nitroreductase HBN1 n=1 Tax=Diplogelasinospora grovesii TaxID=303347 RepID=A0AAN6N5Q6_9PEZI|nr:putative nitroreductase HBN1 [Diplogelasinospora grovesii]
MSPNSRLFNIYRYPLLLLLVPILLAILLPIQYQTGDSELFMQRIVKSVSRAFSSIRTTSTLAITPAVTRQFTTTTPAKMSSINANTVIDLIKNRRTYYPLSKDLTISPERIQEIVKEAVQHVPSSFNSQSNRVVVLFGAEHEKLWDLTAEVLKGMVPADNWEPTQQKINMFKAAAGTIMFFEDQTVVEGMQAKFALYADKFPIWAMQSDAMLQHTLWVALEAEGLGANLQHYNPIIDEKVQQQWKQIPATWKLNAQLVFGGKTGDAGEKAFKPIEEKMFVFGN